MKPIQFTLNADEVLSLNAHISELFQLNVPKSIDDKIVFANLSEVQMKLHKHSFLRKAKNKLMLSPAQALSLLIAYRRYIVTDSYAKNTLIQITTAIDQKIV